MTPGGRRGKRERDRLGKQTEKEVIQRRVEGESREIDVQESKKGFLAEDCS